MAAEPGRVLEPFSRAPAQVSSPLISLIDRVVHERDRRPFVKLLLILLVLQMPLDFGGLVWTLLK
jgi:hypothetical protein